MKGKIELYNISFLILKVELHFKANQKPYNYVNRLHNFTIYMNRVYCPSEEVLY